MGDNVDPGAGGATTTGTASSAAAQADTTGAQKRISDLEGQRTALISQEASAGPLDKPALESRIRNLETQLSSAYRDLSSTTRANAELASKQALGMNGPQAIAAYGRAQADMERATGYETRANAYAETTGAKRDLMLAQAKDAEAQAGLRDAQAQVASATTADQIQAAQVAVQQAQANVDATRANIGKVNADTGLTNAQAGKTSAETNQVTELTPALVDSYVAKGELDRATADQIKTLLPASISELQSRGELSKAQADRLNTLLPLEAQQATGNIEQQKLGKLYGVGDRINAMRDAIAQGKVTPDEANNELQSYINSQVAEATTGASQFDRNHAALDAETTRRGQDSSLAGTEMSTYGSGFSSGLSTFQKLNDTIAPGSDAGGRGFLASMNLLANRLATFKPSTPIDSPLLNSLAAPAATTPVVPAAPTTTIAPDGTVTIQHTSTDTSTPQPNAAALLPAGAAGTAADPNVAGSPAQPGAAFAQSDQPEGRGVPTFLQQPNPLATSDDVSALWANDQHLNPSSAGAGQE